MSNDRNGEKLLTAEYEAVFRYALALCANEADAYDITQETFLKALRAKDSFKGESGLYTWLCSIAKNTWLDLCKKRNRLDSRAVPEDIPDDELPIEEREADRDLALIIHRALHTLNDPYKEVFSLRVFGQLSFVEISQIFGKSESWSRVTYHRAKKKIIEILRKDDQI